MPDGRPPSPVDDTIFALSSGSPPAAIAIVRLSGPEAGPTLSALTGRPPQIPRHAVVSQLRDARGMVLDSALVLWFPGPNSATGEDCAELHCHGGRAVVAAVQRTLAEDFGLRQAEAGEFTRRAFANGRIDLAQAEALGDLLTAETELQRRVAQAGVGGALSQTVKGWRDEVLQLAALVEATLDFAEEDEIGAVPAMVYSRAAALRMEIVRALNLPRSERLKEGIAVVLAGPPNSGKSSLFNALLGESAAIVTATPGTTRDALERSIAWEGIPFTLIDTAGLRETPDDAIEEIGIIRARERISAAQIVLWLGPEGQGPLNAWEVQSRCDEATSTCKGDRAHRVSALTHQGIPELVRRLVDIAATLLPRPGSVAVNTRQADHLDKAVEGLSRLSHDPLLTAEGLRQARVAFDRLLGASGTDDMLDRLFSGFCIGK